MVYRIHQQFDYSHGRRTITRFRNGSVMHSNMIRKQTETNTKATSTPPPASAPLPHSHSPKHLPPPPKKHTHKLHIPPPLIHIQEMRRIVQRLPLDLCNVLKETGAHARILCLIVVVVVDQQRSCVGRSNARGGRLCT